MTISKKKNKKDMLSIWQWATAYDIFMSTYITNHLNSVLELIKYGNNIRNMAKQFGFQAAKSYDASFVRLGNLWILNGVQSMMNSGGWQLIANLVKVPLALKQNS